MEAGLVQGEGFAVDASVIEADASRYHGSHAGGSGLAGAGAPDTRGRRVPGALDDDDPTADRKPPKVISLSDPCLAWTAKANKRVQFGYGLQLSDQHGERRHCGRRGHAGANLRRSRCRQDDDRADLSERMGLKTTTYSSRPPRLTAPASSSARWLRRRHRAANPSLGQEHNREDGNVLTQRLHVRPRAQCLCLPRREVT